MDNDQQKQSFLHPRFWGMWLAIGLLRLITLLPWQWQMSLGKSIGLFMYKLLKSRRHVANINIKLAFPELSTIQQKQLCRNHFISLGQGLMDLSLSWWGADKKLQSLTKIEGREYLQQALDTNKGVILLSMHFTSLEIGGPIVTSLSKNLHVVYKPHKNLFLEHIVAKVRAHRYGKAIPKNRIREMITSLKKGHAVWFAPDQSFKHKGSLQIPFFGIDVPTNPSTSRLASISKATVVPFITVREYDKNHQAIGYISRFLPALQHFPSNDIKQDAIRINQLFEAQIRQFPEQYLWTHKRFKATADSGVDYYARVDDK